MKKTLIILAILGVLVGYRTVNAFSPQYGIASGLLGYWSLDTRHTKWTSPTAGTTYDMSGSNNLGTMTNMAKAGTPVYGKMGQGFTFDATDDYVSTTNVINIAVTTISAWVRVRGTPASGLGSLVAGFMDGISSPTQDKELYIGTDMKPYFYVYDGAPKTTSAPASALALNTWYHLVGTADGTTIKLYINGVLSGTALAGNSFTGYTVPNFFIRGYSSSITSKISEDIDDVRVYNRALSGNEVSALYRLGLSQGKR